ncbi:unnamed protein product [Adineta ricciae]|uniref:Ig-like domain-containing protein n=1 Tax=Adineta ricciae TaxID=249248 RepID=A0A815E9B3_ADIRI|nr:unnamed protein product [Adineta ricciae]
MGHGRMNYTLKSVRFVLICMNASIFLWGTALLGEGIDLLVTRRFQTFAEFISNIEDEDLMKTKISSDQSLYLFTILPGIILTSIGFFGCSGAVTQIKCLLFSYSCSISIVLIFQTIILISFINFRIQLKEQLESRIKFFLRSEYQGPLVKNLPLSTFLWDYTMYRLKCCGIEGTNDFEINSKWNRTNPWWNRSMTIDQQTFKYPLTCCPIDELSKNKKNSLSRIVSCAVDGTNVYETNCYEKSMQMFHSNESTILTLIFSIMTFEMIALIFVLIIYNRNRMKEDYHILEQLPPPYTPRKMIASFVVFNLFIIALWCQNIERVVVPQGQPFSFNCQADESVYFARKINEWSEIRETDDQDLNLRLQYLTQDNLLRVSCESAQSKHTGFYACRKGKWTSTSMNSIYQLIIADVDSFYWNFVCHGPIGSCQRSDDLVDENLSRFEVADQTNLELHCCASVTGYTNVNIDMNQVGDTRDTVEVNKKQELDGSWVVCANQRTILRRNSYSNQRTLRYAILPDPSSGYTFYTEDKPNFNGQMAILGYQRQPKLSRGKKLAIIFGSVFGGLVLLSLVLLLIVCKRRNKTTSSRTITTPTMQITKPYLPVKTSEPPRYLNDTDSKDEEPIYEEPTPLSVHAPVFMRC